MEIYSSLNIEHIKIPSSQSKYQTILKDSFYRNSYLLRLYSKNFYNTSNKVFPFKVHRFIIDHRQKFEFPSKQIERRSSAPEFFSRRKFIPIINEKTTKIPSLISTKISEKFFCGDKNIISEQKKQACGHGSSDTHGKLIEIGINNQSSLKIMKLGSKKQIKLNETQKKIIRRQKNAQIYFRQSQYGTKTSVNFAEVQSQSQMNVIEIGYNNHIFQDRIRIYCQNMQKKTSLKLKNWLTLNKTGGFRSHNPDFFIHRKGNIPTPNTNSINFLDLKGQIGMLFDR